jgi:hypothetical protein
MKRSICSSGSFGRGWGKRNWIERDSDFDPMRADPRFERLLAKLT